MDFFGIDLSIYLGGLTIILTAVGNFIPKFKTAMETLDLLVDAIQDDKISEEEEKKIAAKLESILGGLDVNTGIIFNVLEVLSFAVSLFVPKYGKVKRAAKVLLDAIKDGNITNEEEKRIVAAIKAVTK